MKNMRKLFVMALAFIMVLAMATTAFATDGNSISVQEAQKGETYEIYKMLDLSVDLDKNAYSYILNDTWAAFFTDGAGKDYVDIDVVGDISYVTWKEGKDTAAEMEEFGKAAAGYAATLDNADGTQIPSADSTVTFTGLDSGYYLITSTNGTLAMVDTTPDKQDVVITEKNEDPTVTKAVKEDSADTNGTENSAQIGDTIDFTITVTVHKGSKNLVLHDTMDEALTLNADSITVAGLTADVDYDVYTADLEDGCTFEIVFAQAYLDTVVDTTNLVVTYSAVLNEKAVTTEGATNSSKLTWGDSSETTTTTTTTTNTYQFEVLKYVAGDDEKALLANAVFQLHKDGAVVKLIKESETEYRVANGEEDGAVETFITVDADNIVIKGVDLDAYELVEITPPAGYNQLKEPVPVTVDAANNLVVEVANNAGTELPDTGGIGTTIFYVIGGVLVLATVVLLVTKRRMRTAE